jgi:hypothetical protein
MEEADGAPTASSLPDMIRWLRRLNAAAIFLAVIGASPAAQAGLALQLTDGSRVSVGELAAVTDSAVTVAAVAPGVRIERTLPWHRIAAATVDGEPYSPDELRLALGLAAGNREQRTASGLTSAPLMPITAPAAIFGFAPPLAVRACGLCSPFPVPCSPLPLPTYSRVIGVRPDPLAAYADLIPAIYPNGIPSTEMPFALALLRERRRVEAIGPFIAPGPWLGPGAMPGPSIGPAPLAPSSSDDLPLPVPGGLSQIEARVVPLRAGGGADVNALAVELVGFDAGGNTLPVEGTAQAFLYAGRQDLVRAFDNVYVPRPEGLIRLAEWTRPAEPGRRLLLRLPEPLPDHNPHVSANGTLRVRLSVPGQGVFETLAELVPLRPASPLRDVLRAETGSRFLPDERTTGRPFQAWPHQRDFSSVD